MNRSGPRGGKGGKSKEPGDQVICLCNNVARATIEDAICNGADTLNKIYDRTTAGVGPCGGSCRRKLAPMLDTYLETGAFPEVIREAKGGKAPKR